MASERLYEGIDANPNSTKPEKPDRGDAYPWPTLSAEALYGLAGDFVRIVAPQSEADLSALLAQFLGVFGCAVGSGPHVLVESTKHTARLDLLLVGATAGGRKGTASDRVQHVFRIADEAWLEAAYVSGLASGEGLIARVREREDGEPVEKRVLVVEPEFARIIAVASRDGSILSAVVRDAWDTGRLQHQKTKDPIIARDCHIGIIGHITAEELRAKLSTTEVANGFLNRFIVVGTKRRQRLPNGGTLTDADLAPIAKPLRDALDFGREVKRMRRTVAAEELWNRFYLAVPEPDGLLGAATARAEAQALRLSIIFALLDLSAVIDVPHLKAALAFWDYGYASAQHVFGTSLGDDVADRLLDEIRAVYPEGLDRDAQRDVFSRHVQAARLRAARESLIRRQLIRIETVETEGRSREVAYALTQRALSAESAGSPLESPHIAHSALNAHSPSVTSGASDQAVARINLIADLDAMLPAAVPHREESDFL